jgi:outer membrane biosynthesis protein TonB
MPKWNTHSVQEEEPATPPEAAAPPAADQATAGHASGDHASDPSPGDAGSPTLRGSRWVDYDTHELLEMISDLEDERRWARLREGIWIAVLLHLALLSAITWIPKYVFKVPRVISPIDAIKDRKDLSYLDLPPDALREFQNHPTPKVAPPKQTTVDKKTLEALKRAAPPAPAPAAPQPPPPPVATTQPTIPPPVQPPPPAAPAPEAPRPSAVPARPNFALNSDNPADQLREELKNSRSGSGSSAAPALGGGNGLTRHPGAGSGGVEVLSDTQGVDFRAWLQRWHRETEITWDPLIPDEVNPPILKSGMVAIRFKVLPNGRLMDGSLQLEGRSGDTALDRAAWGALTDSNYPPLPRDFKGPYLELRAYFMYNMQPPGK